MFSRYCWLIPLKQKLASNVRAALESIVAQNQLKFSAEAKPPRVVWSDNGTEFQGEFAAYLRENGTNKSLIGLTCRWPTLRT